jgi:hypothetical protein
VFAELFENQIIFSYFTKTQMKTFKYVSFYIRIFAFIIQAKVITLLIFERQNKNITKEIVQN